MAIKLPRKVKKKTVSQLKKIADKYFSLWIRERDKKCCCCGSIMNLQCGHYISRSWMALRYYFKNAHAQCVGCNIFKSGNMFEYTKFMIRTYGPGIIEELDALKKPYQMKTKELEEIIERYKLSPT